MRIEGVVQRYAWGDHEAIPRLIGAAPDGEPWAEFWMGTHPVAPARLTSDGPAGTEHQLLSEVTGPLPFLFKVLAASEPLSLQTHPNLATAQANFVAESADGLDLHDPRRLYHDPYAKPEILCALGDFEVLCGFRPISESVNILRSLRDDACDRLAELLAQQGIGGALRVVFLDSRIDTNAIARACSADAGRTSSVTAAIADLATRYPSDPALTAALLLNHRVLHAREAIFLGPGNLHAYLRGWGVELMDPSDNVLRAGFTPKHVDPIALLDILDTRPLVDPVVRPEQIARDLVEYPTPTPHWRLRRIDLDGQFDARGDAVGVLLSVRGTCAELPTGQPAVITASENFALHGEATIYWATGRAASTDGRRD